MSTRFPLPLGGLALCLALLAGCQHAPAPEAALPEALQGAEVDRRFAPAATEMDAFSYPVALGNLQIVGATQYEHRYQGFALRYGSTQVPDMFNEVLIYPVVRPELLSLADLLDQHFRTLGSELEAAARNGQWDRIEPVSSASFSWGGKRDGLEGIHGVFRMHAGERSFDSHVYLAVRDGRFYQARLTHPSGGDYPTESIARRLLSAIHAKRPGTAREPEILVLIPASPAHPGADYTASLGMTPWMGYAATQAEAIRAGHFLDTFDRRLAASRAALSAWAEVARQGIPGDPAILQLDAAARAGYLEEYVWATQAKPYWLQPKGLNLEGFQLWRQQLGPGLEPAPGVIIRWHEPAKAGAPASP